MNTTFIVLYAINILFHIGLGIALGYFAASKIHPNNMTQKVIYCVVLPTVIWMILDLPHFIITNRCPLVNRIVLSSLISLVIVIVYLIVKVKIRKEE